MRLVPWLGIIYMRELALNNFFEKSNCVFLATRVN